MHYLIVEISNTWLNSRSSPELIKKTNSDIFSSDSPYLADQKYFEVSG